MSIKRESDLYPFVATIIALCSIIFMDNVYCSAILILLSSLLWFRNINIIQTAYGREQEQYKIISGRIMELKNFSLELESMVNKELALVQDDVVRIRELVADSIVTLQSGVSSIHECAHTQCEIIQTMGVETGTYPNNNDKQSTFNRMFDTDNIKFINDLVADDLGIAIYKIDQSIESIKKIEMIAAATINDTDKVNEKSKNDLAISNYLSSIDNIRLSLTESIEESKTAILETVKKVRGIQLDNLHENYQFSQGHYKNIEDQQAKIKDNMISINRALQFEDIVGQISERVASHVSDIRSTVNILSHLCDSEFSSTFESDIESMREQLNTIRQHLDQSASVKLASHRNMDEGEIDLF